MTVHISLRLEYHYYDIYNMGQARTTSVNIYRIFSCIRMSLHHILCGTHSHRATMPLCRRVCLPFIVPYTTTIVVRCAPSLSSGQGCMVGNCPQEEYSGCRIGHLRVRTICASYDVSADACDMINVCILYNYRLMTHSLMIHNLSTLSAAQAGPWQ